MNRRAFLGWVIALSLLGALGAAAATSIAPRPNVLFILADDLGYGDLGSFGQRQIRTPNLDRLAAEGMRLTAHYSGNNVCAPSRCVLLSGKHPGHAYIRDNRQARATGWPSPEGQVPVPARELQLPLILQRLGYINGGFGKWGLGPVGSSGEPMRQGFDRFFGYNCQAVAHNYYPTSLWDNGTRVPLSNAPFAAHQKLPTNALPEETAAYARYAGADYAPDRIAAAALAFLRENRARPFFLFYPSTLPHLALQPPADGLAEYAGRFPEEPYRGDRSYLPHRTPRAAYAAMVTRLDREVGNLLATLRELGLETNTVVVFSSDNGPLYDRLGGTDTDFFRSASDFRGRKGSMYEGGLRVPCLVRWPGKIAAGTRAERVTGFEDWLPTLLELIGEAGSVPAGIDGMSFAPTLLGRAQAPRDFLYRESPGYGGQQCVRLGRWKAVRRGLHGNGRRPDAPVRTELYDLSKDPSETTDVAALFPEILAQAEARLAREHQRSDLFPIAALDGVVPPAAKSGGPAR